MRAAGSVCCSVDMAAMAYPIRYRSLQDRRGVREVHLIWLKVPCSTKRKCLGIMVVDLPRRIFGEGCSSESGDYRNNVGSKLNFLLIDFRTTPPPSVMALMAPLVWVTNFW